METVGGVISGYWATGKFVMAIMPTSTITTDITMAVTGLLIKVSAIIILLFNPYYGINFMPFIIDFISAPCLPVAYRNIKHYFFASVAAGFAGVVLMAEPSRKF